jgi:hypothetical protein
VQNHWCPQFGDTVWALNHWCPAGLVFRHPKPNQTASNARSRRTTPARPRLPRSACADGAVALCLFSVEAGDGWSLSGLPQVSLGAHSSPFTEQPMPPRGQVPHRLALFSPCSTVPHLLIICMNKQRPARLVCYGRQLVPWLELAPPTPGLASRNFACWLLKFTACYFLSVKNMLFSLTFSRFHRHWRNRSCHHKCTFKVPFQ